MNVGQQPTIRSTERQSAALRNATSRTARAGFAVAAAIALLLPTGCALWRKVTGQPATSSSAEAATTRPATTQLTSVDIAPLPPSLAPANRPVVQGPLPLIYLAEGEGTLRVRNVETGEEIITFPVKAGQVVRVDSKGIFIGRQTIIGANLASGTYAIEFVYDTPGIRSTQDRNVIQSQ